MSRKRTAPGEPIPVVDPKDPVFAALNRRTRGMSPQERVKYISELSDRLPSRPPRMSATRLAEDAGLFGTGPLRVQGEAALEAVTRQRLDSVLGRTAIWFKGFDVPEDAAPPVKAFARLSKRKKLLTLILLTDPANERLPRALEPHHGHASVTAWNALNWIVLDGARVEQLLQRAYLTGPVRGEIQRVVSRRSCDDQAGTVLDGAPKTVLLGIAQYGSLKQRAGMVEFMSAEAAQALVCSAEGGLLMKCIEAARELEQ